MCYLFTGDNIIRKLPFSEKHCEFSAFFGGIIPVLFPCKNTEKRTERCTTRLINKEGVVHFKPNQYILKKGFWKVKFKLTLTYDKLNTKIIYPLEIPMKRTPKL